MKSVTVAPRSGFLIKDTSEYLLISILFNRLLLAICLDKTNPLEQHKFHEIKRFPHQCPVNARTGLRQFQRNCFVILLAKNRLVATEKCFQIQLREAVAGWCSVKKISQYS